jgi:hypothetical protein
MKYSIFAFAALLMTTLSFSQKKVSNVIRKDPGQMASIVKDTLTRWLTLSPVQSDSIQKIYKDYFTGLSGLQSNTTISSEEKMQTGNQLRFASENRMKNVLTASQYEKLNQQRKAMQEKRSLAMDSTRARRENELLKRNEHIDSLIRAHQLYMKNMQHADSLKKAQQQQIKNPAKK